MPALPVRQEEIRTLPFGEVFQAAVFMMFEQESVQFFASYLIKIYHISTWLDEKVWNKKSLEKD